MKVLLGVVLALVSGGSVWAEDSSPALECDGCVKMAVIPAASFEMGGYVDYGWGTVNGPKRTVELPSFAMAVAEVTVGEFRKFVEATGFVTAKTCNIYTDTTSWHIDTSVSWDNPGFPQEENHPVVCLNLADIEAYIKWLNGVTGNSYRLPSEAEWEYVASTGGLSSGEKEFITHDEGNIGQVECCGGAIEGKDTWHYTAPVMSFPPDKYGLYDIRGNVWERQADCYQVDYIGASADGSARTQCDDDSKSVIRGGSYGDAGDYLSPRYRLPGVRAGGYFTAGFRLAHSLP